MSMGTAGCGNCVVEILDKGGLTSGTWTARNARLMELERLASSGQQLCVVFAQAKQFRECKECRPILSKLFSISPSFWTVQLQRSNGYFGCENSYDNEDRFESHYTWFRYLVKQMLDHPAANKKDYFWYKVNVLTRWWPTGRNLIICFDAPPSLRMRFPSPLLDHLDSTPNHDPYWIHVRFLEELVAIHDGSIWSIRNLVRQTELSRTSSTRPNPDYLRLHDIARHAAHSTETLNVAVKTIDGMVIQHDHFVTDRSSMNPTASKRYDQTRNRLLFYSQMLHGLKYRSEANRERLQNEITLAFNTVAQYDTKVSVQIGQAAQSDSAAMKTVAFLTLTFLPATFISSLFSTSFFNFSPGSQDKSSLWSISDRIWIYWAVVVPLTGVTIASWFLWRRYFPVDSIGT